MNTPLLDGIKKEAISAAAAAILGIPGGAILGGGLGAGIGALVDKDDRSRGAKRGLAIGGISGGVLGGLSSLGTHTALDYLKESDDFYRIAGDTARNLARRG